MFLKIPVYCILISLLVNIASCANSDNENAIAPNFLSSTPIDGADDIDVSQTVSVVFDEVISLVSNHGITVNNEPVDVIVTDRMLTLEVNLEYGRNYIVVIPAGDVKNLSGVALQQTIEFSFTTITVPSAPVFFSSIPMDGAISVNTFSQVRIQFDQAVEKTTDFNLTLNGVAVDATISDNILIAEPLLEPGGEYEVRLDAGSVVNLQGLTLQDDIAFSFFTKSVAEVSSELAVSTPSPEAVNVYNFLKENYGKKLISATMANVNWNINEAQWVYSQTGKYPAMTTFDYVHLPYSPANWIDYSQIDFVEEWWQNNGLVSAGWHWLVPASSTEVDNIQSYTYKPEETSFDASNALVEGTWENDFLKADLQKIAGYLKLLQQQNIPVVWRPLHEAAGNIYVYNNGKAWFWWGSDGAETYKALWQYMFNYLEDNGINNLIWVWTTQTNDADFYPGDEYVDIIGRDIYNNLDSQEISEQFELIQSTYPNKIITLSECGSVANMSDQWSSGARWSWFMPWYDYDRTNDVNEADFAETDHEHANAAWWSDAMSQQYVISRDEMPDLK